MTDGRAELFHWNGSLRGRCGLGGTRHKTEGDEVTTHAIWSFLGSDAFDQGFKALFRGIVGADSRLRLDGLAVR